MEALMSIGGFVPLSYVFYGVIQNARQKRQINTVGVLLAFIGVLLPVSLITWGLLTGQSEVFLTLAALASAGVMLLFGLIAITQDARAGQPLSRSNGFMGVGAGLLIIIAALVITQVMPLVSSPSTTSAASASTVTRPNFAAASAAGAAGSNAATNTADTTASSAAAETVALPAAPAGFALPGDIQAAAIEPVTGSVGAVAAEAVVPAAPAGFTVPGAQPLQVSATAADTIDEQPQASAPSLTIDEFVASVMADVGEVQITPATVAQATTPADAAASAGNGAAAPVADSASAIACQAIVRNNLNLRSEASASGDLLTTIPYATALTASGRTDDNWWHVSYNGIDGWVSGDYLDLSESCSS